MKIKKKLKEECKKIDEKILAANQDMYNELVEKYCVPGNTKKSTSKNFTKWTAAVSCVLVVCLVVGISIILTQPSAPKYLDTNEIGTDITLEEFKLGTNSKIEFGHLYSVSNFLRVNDSISSDILCYRLAFEHKEDYVTGQLYVVVNKYYRFTENYSGEKQKTKFGIYDMEFSVKETFFEELPINEYFGCLQYNEYKIYFSFEELKQEEDASPIPVLKDLLIMQ